MLIDMTLLVIALWLGVAVAVVVELTGWWDR